MLENDGMVGSDGMLGNDGRVESPVMDGIEGSDGWLSRTWALASARIRR